MGKSHFQNLLYNGSVCYSETNSKVKLIKNMIDLRNYRVSSQEFYKKTGFRAKKSVSQAYKSFNNFFK